MAGESPRLRFDPVINWGHVLIVTGILASGVGVYIAGEVRASNLEYRLKALEIFADRNITANEKLIDQLNDIRIEIATMKARLPPPQSSLAPFTPTTR